MSAPPSRGPEAMALALHLLRDHGQQDAHELADLGLEIRHALLHSEAEHARQAITGRSA